MNENEPDASILDALEGVSLEFFKQFDHARGRPIMAIARGKGVGFRGGWLPAGLDGLGLLRKAVFP
jgi:hypothetical protein